MKYLLITGRLLFFIVRFLGSFITYIFPALYLVFSPEVGEKEILGVIFFYGAVIFLFFWAKQKSK